MSYKLQQFLKRLRCAWYDHQWVESTTFKAEWLKDSGPATVMHCSCCFVYKLSVPLHRSARVVFKENYFQLADNVYNGQHNIFKTLIEKKMPLTGEPRDASSYIFGGKDVDDKN